MASRGLPPHVDALLRPAAYPFAVGAIELVQTHVSYVFLTEARVFKLKKAVDLGFLDFTTLEKRRHFCEEEVRLNQRACAGVYLGVWPVTKQDGAYRLGGEGEVVDYAVEMRRLPAAGMMDSLLARDAVDLRMVGRVAAKLADLHARAERGPAIQGTGGSETLARNWRAALNDMRRFVGRTLGERRWQRIQAYATSFLERESALLRRREDEGWIRACHGDLRSDAVCFDAELTDGVCFFDCIEFNDAFRYSDTGLDAAFLAMDLDYRGRQALSDAFAGLYAAAIGDRELPLLLDFYKCYRATVRGRVESMLAEDAEVTAGQRSAARKRAQAYFRLAESYTRRRRRAGVILVMGASGSGKSVLAGAIAARLGAVILSTDVRRRELFEMRGRAEAVDDGIYTPEAREQVYGELARKAATALRAARAVVLDGTYIERRQREPVLRLARESGRKLLVVECSAPDAVVAERQRGRRDDGWSASEGRWEVYLAQKARYEPPDETAASQRLTVDTTLPLEEQIVAVLTALEGR